MAKKFTDKTAIVTGAGSGIGYAIATSLIQEGANVVINDKAPDLLDKLPSTGQVRHNSGDMASLSDIQHLVRFTLDTFGSVDLLIANAGITAFSNFLEVSEQAFDEVVALNMKGTYFLVQEVAKSMKAHGGKILMMSSNISKRAYPELSLYSMTKAALNMMARSLSVELSEYAININALAPGPTLTERTKKEGQDYEKSWSALIPTGRLASVDDIAKTAVFLLSEDARQINGQTIFVDGGWSGIGVNPEN